MQFKTFILILFSSLSTIPVLIFAVASPNRIVDPDKYIGAITKNTSEIDLIKLYGKKNVKRIEIGVGEGETVDGTVLFMGSRSEIFIEWKKKFTIPGRVSIHHKNSSWKLKKGIRFGSTLSEVEKINGKPIKITGFEWDYPGRTTSWGKGKLNSNLQLDFEPRADIPGIELSKVSGDGSFSSENKIIKKLKLTVKVIYIRWDLN
ncbi:hypothetical protein MNBD_GAMMA12-2731 [hydrothermal vent metagenome]|uniref:Uncharacterized protein n=1 Tax=hydrothermal vent metagenome TaxID=652676 RepID=A0A3B0YIK2_9ZZZZ